MNKKIKIIFILTIIFMAGFFIFKNYNNKLFTNKNNESNIEVINEELNELNLLEEKDDNFFVVETVDKINPTMPEYLFKIYGYKNEENFSYSANKIIISEKDNQEKVIQEIIFEDTQTYDEEFFGFVMEDMNFDGYKDIRIQSFVPAGPNTPYYYWLWDNESFKYLRNNELEKITAPEFDSENKLVVSYIRISAIEYWTHKYKYENNALILLNEEKTIY